VRVKEKRPLDQIPHVMAVIREAERQLDGNGRVNVRYSGTESLVRVMVEAESQETVHKLADNIASAIEQALGTGAPSGR
jgi:phosphoglucosamine mutase